MKLAIKPIATALALFTVAIFSAENANAYVSIRSSSSGAVVRWAPGSPLYVRANISNSSGLSSNSIFNIITTAMGRWKQSADNGFGFSYYQGSDTSRYPVSTGATNENAIFFTSQAASNAQIPCGTIGLTEVWFDPNSGKTTRFDMRLNDKCFQFTTAPNDSGGTRVYLGDVVTHEFGHALGLDHSQNLQSTMGYTAAVQMHKLSCDEHTAMQMLYSGSGERHTGVITGSIVSPTGSALFGAHVQAINLERGTVMASALTEASGRYTIAGLEPGNYAVLAEPYYPGSSTLGPYYGSISANVCSGSAFQRTFLSAGGTLTSLHVAPGPSTEAGSLMVSCTAPGSLNAFAERVLQTAPLLTTTDLALGNSVGTASRFSSTSEDHYYIAKNQTGLFRAQALSYSIYSRPDVVVELLDSGGRILSQTANPNVFTAPESGYINYDASASANLGASPTTVIVHVYTRSLVAASKYPSGGSATSTTYYYALTLSNEASIPSNSTFEPNARCEEPDSFPQYVQQGDAPTASGPSGSSSQSNDSGNGPLGCGTIYDENGGGGSGGFGSPIRLANFMMLFLMLTLARRIFALSPRR